MQTLPQQHLESFLHWQFLEQPSPETALQVVGVEMNASEAMIMVGNTSNMEMPRIK